MMLTSLLFLCLGGLTMADLRWASQPKQEWKLQQRNRDVPFRHPAFPLYMEPSDFNYAKLKNQRARNYDNFLRSNIDNEQDNRNFDTEKGEDHLPFRSFETAGNDVGEETVETKMTPVNPNSSTGVTAAGNYIVVTENQPYVVPLRWNNPHAAELEVNIWIMKKGQADQKFVVPVMRPTCSGEGYQDNVFDFKVPTGFPDVCNTVGDCVLQVYAHSVESRMYASGTPVIVQGATGTWNEATVQEAEQDFKFNLDQLRPLCLSRADADAHHNTAVVYQARLSSDQYNHAYQNSDFSPYAGQQPRYISQNLQAACILKMTANNFGELGKEYMQKTAPEARRYAHELDRKARHLIREYEKSADNIINAIKDNVKNDHTFPTSSLGLDDVVECTTSTIRRGNGQPYEKEDRTKGYCTRKMTCMCHQDCIGDYWKDGKRGEFDAYCGKITNNSEGQMVVEEDSQQPRLFLFQKTETCFRCREVGSTTKRRHNTNTYIPSFEIIGKENVNLALDYVTGRQLRYGLMQNPNSGTSSTMGDENATLSIYMAVLTEMWDEFKMASEGTYHGTGCPYTNYRYDPIDDISGQRRTVESGWEACQARCVNTSGCSYFSFWGDGGCHLSSSAAKRRGAGGVKSGPKSCEGHEVEERFKFTYRGPVLKATTTTLSDANGGIDRNYRKRDADDKHDRGYYSAAKAWYLQNRENGSSTAVPNRDGPLNLATMYNQTLKYPPLPAAKPNCSAGLLNVAGSGEQRPRLMRTRAEVSEIGRVKRVQA